MNRKFPERKLVVNVFLSKSAASRCGCVIVSLFSVSQVLILLGPMPSGQHPLWVQEIALWGLWPGGHLPGRVAVLTRPLASSVQAERVPLGLSPRLEEALDFSEAEAEPSEGEDFEARGSRFSKSADERQRMLVQRKDDLLQQARK